MLRWGQVTAVAQREQARRPAPPFTTSTLQQEASAKLGLSPARTMALAQQLYEGVEEAGGAHARPGDPREGKEGTMALAQQLHEGVEEAGGAHARPGDPREGKAGTRALAQQLYEDVEEAGGANALAASLRLPRAVLRVPPTAGWVLAAGCPRT